MVGVWLPRQLNNSAAVEPQGGWNLPCLPSSIHLCVSFTATVLPWVFLALHRHIHPFQFNLVYVCSFVTLVAQ